MRFLKRIKLYREMKLWLVGVPVLCVVATSSVLAQRLAGATPRGSDARFFWEMVSGVVGVFFFVGCLALVACTVGLLWKRIDSARFLEWFTTDD